MEKNSTGHLRPHHQKIIFFNSYLPRTGHNFAAEVLRIFTDHEVLTHSRSETPLSSLLASYHSIKKRNYYESDRVFIDSLFIQGLREKILDHSSQRMVMIKDTSITGVDHLPVIFPNDFHFILLRDPKQVFVSLLKGMNLKKKSLKNKVKKWTIPFGAYPFLYSRKISSQVLEKFPDLGTHHIIRYEDLVRKDRQTLLFLKKKFETDKSLGQIKKEMDAIHVINTSFYNETGANNIWDMKPKTSAFKPLERKSFNFLVIKAVELGSKRLRKKLKYI